jgi:hypothetical protein
MLCLGRRERSATATGQNVCAQHAVLKFALPVVASHPFGVGIRTHCFDAIAVAGLTHLG